MKGQEPIGRSRTGRRGTDRHPGSHRRCRPARRSSALGVLALALLLPGSAAAFIQAPQQTSSLAGTIADDSGEGLPGALIKITDTRTKIMRTVISDADGNFSALSLPVGGPYTLEASFEGFATARRAGIEIRAGVETRLDIVLALETVAEEIVVTPGVALIEANDDDGVFDPEQLDILFGGVTASSPEPLGADLAIDKSDGGVDPAAPGEQIPYRLTIVNNGPLAATDISVIDSLPAGVQLVSATTAAGGCALNSFDEVACSLGTLPPGFVVTIDILVDVPESLAGTTLSNEATALAAELDPDIDNNTATEITAVAAPATPAGNCALMIPNDSQWTGNSGCGFGSVTMSCGSPADPNTVMIAGPTQTTTCDGSGFCGNDNVVFGDPRHRLDLLRDGLQIIMDGRELDIAGQPTGNQCHEIFDLIGFAAPAAATLARPAATPPPAGGS